MAKDKSILEKITDTMKDIANIAADAADHAMKEEQPSPKAAERSAAYIPLAADGLVSDPMMVPPIAAAHAPRRKRAASRRGGKGKQENSTKEGRQESCREGREKIHGPAIKKRRQNDRKEDQQENGEEEREESAQGNSQSAVAACGRRENRLSKGIEPGVIGQPFAIPSRSAAQEN